MVEYIGARKARQQFADLLGSVHYGGRVVIVERSGKPMVAVIPVGMYEQIVAEREARFQVTMPFLCRAAPMSPVLYFVTL